MLSWFNNLKTSVKLLGGFLVIAAMLAAVAVIGYINMNTINTNLAVLYDQRMIPVQHLGTISTELYRIRGDVYKFILLPQEQSKTAAEMDKAILLVEDEIAKYKAIATDKAELDQIKTFVTTFEVYHQCCDQDPPGYARRQYRNRHYQPAGRRRSLQRPQGQRRRH